MSGPKYQVVQGFKFAPSSRNVQDGLNYVAAPDDVFIVTYPKNGTTWTQQIVVLIFNDGEIPVSGVSASSPFLEMAGQKSVQEMVRPGAIKTHLPYHLQPKNPTAKYIIVIRNPKDACVSFYYHHKSKPAYGFDGTFHEFFHYWMLGEVECGDYFDWINSWWNQRRDPHILFLFYEDMKKDPKGNILKIAEFLGGSYKDKLLANDGAILSKVAERSSFDYMKEMASTKTSKGDFMRNVRKGIVGDWRNHFSEEESKLLEEKAKEKLSGDGDILLNKWRQAWIMPGPKFQVVQGFKFAPSFPNVQDGLNYVARPDDVFIVTYPKNGTTWTQQILILMFNDGEVPEIVIQEGVSASIPFLELAGQKICQNMPRPGAIKTHLPYHLQPKNPTAKYIIVIRNPKDACISFYYHQKMFPAYEFDGTIHDFLPYWLSGEVECGDYFDWITSWWSQRKNHDILFLFFEDMKEDPKGNILKIAEFLGGSYKDKLLANDGALLSKVVERSSIKYMQEMNAVWAKRSKECPIPEFRVAESDFKFVRKGIVGDWRNHFTEEESKLIEDKAFARLSGDGDVLLDKWKKVWRHP